MAWGSKHSKNKKIIIRGGEKPNLVSKNVETGTETLHDITGFGGWHGSEILTSDTNEAYKGERSVKCVSGGSKYEGIGLSPPVPLKQNTNYFAKYQFKPIIEGIYWAGFEFDGGHGFAANVISPPDEDGWITVMSIFNSGSYSTVGIWIWIHEDKAVEFHVDEIYIREF